MSFTRNKPRMVHRIRGDGNCFFRAICYAITGAEDQHLLMRDAIVAHMQNPNYSTTLQAHLDNHGQGLKNYLRRSGLKYLST